MGTVVTDTGFVRPLLPDIITEIEQTLVTQFGATINLNPESIFGQIVGIFADREDQIWQAMEDDYNSKFPDTATGVSLDNVAALVGITRLPATPSLATVTITGTAGTVIPSGSLAQVQNNGPQFEFTTNVTIPTGGTTTAQLQCTATGPNAAPAGTLTIIATPVTGWSTVTNATDAQLGTNVETDSALRARRLEELQNSGSGTVGAIRTALLGLSGVTQVIIFENDTLTTDGNGLPGKSFECFVEGGDNTEIATTIWDQKPAGIATYGTTATSITDSQGFTQIVNWSRPVQELIYVIANLTVDSSYPTGGDTQVLDAILSYGEGLNVGDDVIVSPAMIAAIATVPGIIGATILVGLAPSPTSSANIPIAVNQLAIFDSSRISVNS